MWFTFLLQLFIKKTFEYVVLMRKRPANNVKFTNRDQNIMTKRLNNPNHYKIITSSEKNQTVRATKKQKAKKKKQFRLLESHTRRTANRFSIRMLFVFGLPLFGNSPRIDALESLVFTIYKGTFNYLNWQHSGVENNFQSVVITFHLNGRITLFDVYSQRSRTHIFGPQLISSPTG